MKKNLFKLTLIVCVIIVIGIFVSCNNNVSNESKTEFVNNKVPYATEGELLSILENDKDIVDYRVARTLGLIEMQNFLESCKWSSSATLSLTPIMNKYDDNSPHCKFWETSSCGQLSHYPYRFK